MYYVIGGKYTDTDFLTPEGELEKIGPFDEWTKAYQIWMARSWQHVDSCLTRYRIEEAKE